MWVGVVDMWVWAVCGCGLVRTSYSEVMSTAVSKNLTMNTSGTSLDIGKRVSLVVSVMFHFHMQPFWETGAD
jgi:hypothetical protein